MVAAQVMAVHNITLVISLTNMEKMKS